MYVGVGRKRPLLKRSHVTYDVDQVCGIVDYRGRAWGLAAYTKAKKRALNRQVLAIHLARVELDRVMRYSEIL